MQQKQKQGSHLEDLLLPRQEVMLATHDCW